MANISSPDKSTAASIVLVDDHGVVRAGLARLIEAHEDLILVGQAANSHSALEVVEIKRPDIVVLDITLGHENALDVLPAMLAKSKLSRVLILSMHDDITHVQDAFAAGAHGYLLKEAAETDLIDAIRLLLQGETYVHPTLGARLARAAIAGPPDPLSDREREVARLLSLGHTNQDVSSQLFLSVRTVETHRAHVMAKLRLSSRAELVQWALDSGLIGQTS
ncbi:MAG: response regulator transcription factor [Thermoleophilia bacterium]|nr:response regulator transcription factor [Thermoleophilia bacterium]